MDTVSFLSDKIFEIIDKDKDGFVILNKINFWWIIRIDIKKKINFKDFVLHIDKIMNGN